MPTWEELAAKPSTEKIYLAEIEAGAGRGRFRNQDAQAGVRLGSSRRSRPSTTPPASRGVPLFKRSIQEAFWGRTMTAFGSLVLLIGDGGLDDDLADWNWEGRPVTLKVGFGPLDVSEYKTIFSGRTGKRSWDDGLLTLPILDKQMGLHAAQKGLLHRVRHAGELGERLPDRRRDHGQEHRALERLCHGQPLHLLPGHQRRGGGGHRAGQAALQDRLLVGV